MTGRAGRGSTSDRTSLRSFPLDSPTLPQPAPRHMIPPLTSSALSPPPTPLLRRRIAVPGGGERGWRWGPRGVTDDVRSLSGAPGPAGVGAKEGESQSRRVTTWRFDVLGGGGREPSTSDWHLRRRGGCGPSSAFCVATHNVVDSLWAVTHDRVLAIACRHQTAISVVSHGPDGEKRSCETPR
ncbi:hypothetical protein NL676_001550 [Syzygium grande]|nr:hypothetical protein NL676_001550 [Syzygium grande]